MTKCYTVRGQIIPVFGIEILTWFDHNYNISLLGKHEIFLCQSSNTFNTLMHHMYMLQNTNFFYAPTSKDWRHSVLPLSLCPSVCLHKLNEKTKHLPLTPILIQLQGSYLV